MKTKKTRKKEMRTAFEKYVQRGKQFLTAEELSMIEIRALDSTDAKGGVTVPEYFANKIESAIRGSSFLDVATVVETKAGGSLPLPTMNDSANIGELLVEGVGIGDSADPSFNVKTFKAYTFSSKPVNISNELVQDAPDVFFPVLAQKLAERCVNAAVPYFINGTGVDQPLGFVTGGAKGVDAAIDSVTYNNLTALIKSVDKRFRSGASWAMNDDTLLIIQDLKDTAGNPIIKLSYDKKGTPYLLGYPVQIINEMSDIGAGNVSIAFGNFKKYVVRLVKSMELRRLSERYADYNQTGFILFVRMDGNLLDISETLSPVKYLQHAAS